MLSFAERLAEDDRELAETDLVTEADEWFYLTLANATGAKLGSSLWGNVKIAVND